jgi:hypothetical protein
MSEGFTVFQADKKVNPKFSITGIILLYIYSTAIYYLYLINVYLINKNILFLPI